MILILLLESKLLDTDLDLLSSHDKAELRAIQTMLAYTSGWIRSTHLGESKVNKIAKKIFLKNLMKELIQ